MWGASTRRTSIGWKVIRVHYSADKDKDPRTEHGAKWLTEAKKGMSEARWRKEFEIDYGAMGGQLVFPKFEESIHVTPPRMEELSSEDGQQRRDLHTIWLACDPHPRTAHAFLWLAVSREGEYAVVWSWWPENQNKTHRLVTRDYAAKLKDIDESPLGLEPRYSLMDVAGKSFNADEERSYFDSYRTAKDDRGKDIGIYFTPANKNRDMSGFDLINEALKPTIFLVGNEEKQRPKLTIWDGCGDNDELIFQMKHLRYREFKGNVTDKDPPEAPEEKRKHLVDCLAYIFLDSPRFIERRKRQQPRENHNVVRATAYS